MIYCGVYYRDGRIFVTIPRWSTEDFPLNAFFGETCVDAHSVGALVRQALTAVRSEKEQTFDVAGLRMQADALYKAAGATAWRDFVRGTAHVTVSQEGASITVTPTINAGSREGFLNVGGDGEDDLVAREATEDELGRTVLEGLVRSGAVLDLDLLQ